jgi:hypothetical protein
MHSVQTTSPYLESLPPTWADLNVYGLVFYPPLVGHSFSFGLMAYVLPTPGTMIQSVFLKIENSWHSLYPKIILVHTPKPHTVKKNSS